MMLGEWKKTFPRYVLLWQNEFEHTRTIPNHTYRTHIYAKIETETKERKHRYHQMNLCADYLYQRAILLSLRIFRHFTYYGQAFCRVAPFCLTSNQHTRTTKFVSLSSTLNKDWMWHKYVSTMWYMFSVRTIEQTRENVQILHTT